MPSRLKAQNLTRDTCLAARARVADNALSRLVGLLRDTSLAPGDGLWIVPCNSIHSFGMRFVFDAVFLSRDLRVVHLMPEMKAWRVSPIIVSAHSVLELPAGVIRDTGTSLGDILQMK